MWHSLLAGAEEVSVRYRWLVLNKHQSGLSQTVGHASRWRIIDIPDKLLTPN